MSHPAPSANGKSTATDRPLRLAVYGYLGQDCGSGPASHYLVLCEVLKLGHAIDLYAIAGFIKPGGLAEFPRLSYLPVAIPWADWLLHRFLMRLPRALGWLPFQLFNKVRHWFYYRRLEKLIRQRHAAQPYDALLVLDIISPFRKIDGLPCLNCPPGSPLGELEGLQNCREVFIRYAGRALYYALVTYYRLRVALVRGQERRCSLLLCASPWTAGCWERLGFPRSRIRVIPFSLDLEKFQPAARSSVAADAPVTILHLGRIVPRKRLDLLIDAFRLLQQERANVKLLIIGQFAYAAGYRRLLEPPDLPSGVEYRPSVPRDQVAGIFQAVDILAQPSENEDFGSAVMEALGSGLPVVLGPSNGTAAYTGGGAFQFSAYTSTDVCQALRAAVDAVRTDRAGVATQARRMADSYFQPRLVAARLLDILREASQLPAKAAESNGRTGNVQPTSRRLDLLREPSC
jgi:glycosyltransferase involved in cell wall biosynthesis